MQLTFAFPDRRKNDKFGSFIVDERNCEEAQICRNFCGIERSEKGRSITLYNNSASGKSHLLFAMAKEFEELHSAGGQALYLDGGQLAQKVIETDKYEELKSWISAYEKAPFVAVDQLEKISKNQQAQDQVFHIYNAVMQSGGLFVAGVSRLPSEWNFEDYLQSRLLWGASLRIRQVSGDSLIKVVEKIATDKGFRIGQQVAKWLTTHLSRDIRQIVSAMERIDQRSLTDGRKVSISLVKEALGGGDF